MDKTTSFHLAGLFLRLSLGAGFLSAVADRFGIWGTTGSPSVAWGNFHNFLLYTGKLNPWCPAALLPALGWTATIAEIILGVLLILGLFTRVAGLGSGLPTLCFALAMSFTLGVHAPLNYAVFVCSAASFLLAMIDADHWSLDSLIAGRP
jgi:putative oxidoreductase